MRVWVKSKNYPGLAMTRCFGDQIAKTVGVISEPDIQFFMLNSNSQLRDKAIILGSDGIWDMIQPGELGKYF
jgi:serine/threonine protein phosphatase PrpC